MRFKQEQIVFVVTLVVVAGLSYKLFAKGDAKRGSRGSGDAEELARYPAPPIDVALPDGRQLAGQRSIFSPPRDTYPLPPLPLVEPPRDELLALLPPTVPGPAPAHYGRLLRRELEAVELPALFEDVSAANDSEDGDGGFFDVAVPDDAPSSSLLDSLRKASDETAGVGVLDEDLTPAERAAQVTGFQQRYDWLLTQSGRYRFGRITNRDRYSLKTDSARLGEALRFVEVDPRTGRERLANVGDGSVDVARDTIVKWGFAATFANELEVRRLELGDTLSRASFDRALDLADECVRRWLEAPRALEVAEGLYRRAADFDPSDPAPKLGLARCQESAFDFESAFATYNELLAKFEHRAEVHARLGQLEARWLAWEQAEQRLRHAVAIDGNSWEARHALGRFLLERERADEAIEHLEAANRAAPGDPDKLFERVAIRTDLGAAYFANAKLERAKRAFDQALEAAPDQRARAGRLAIDLLEGDLRGLSENVDGDAGFELLLASGLHALLTGDHEEARDQWLLAVDSDPLRSSYPLAALSALAETTGNSDEASHYAEEALIVDPTNAYALFQKGRLLGLRDDFEGARDALLGALEVELDFEEALVALGDMAFRLGRFEDAERYLERAVALEATRPEVHALRGLNFLRLGSTNSALDAFEAALALDRAHLPARAGKAWCVYLDGEVTEALVQLGQIDDALRTAPATDPMKVWATAQIARITDHQEKEAWSDRFERKKLINEWRKREPFGPVIGMLDGAVRIEGVHQTSGATLVWREYPASLFVSIEADVWIEPRSNVRAGIFVSRERARRNQEPEIVSEASVSRHPEGGLQVRVQRGGTEPVLTDMAQPFPTGRWVRLRIERTGESGNSKLAFSLDGIPLVEGASMPQIGRASTPLLVGLFAEGEPGRQIDVRMDNVEVVYRK